MTRKKVLWMSSEEMIEQQICDMHKIYGDCSIKHYSLEKQEVQKMIRLFETIDFGKYVEFLKKYDVISVDIPKILLKKLLSFKEELEGRPIIRPVYKVARACKSGFIMKYVGWEEVLDKNMNTKRL